MLSDRTVLISEHGGRSSSFTAHLKSGAAGLSVTVKLNPGSHLGANEEVTVLS